MITEEDDYDYDGEDEPETRICDNSCSHFDLINQCCWLASKRGLCTDVCEGDVCIYGFKEEY